MPGSGIPLRLSTEGSVLLVIDVQEKLVPKIDNSRELIRNIAFLIDACRTLSVPAFVTEQYPKGLGPTVQELARRLPSERPEKLAFSSCAVHSLIEQINRSGRNNVLVCGIESHVCVMQTVLDLLALEFGVFVAVDAIGSRYRVDHEVAIRRMEQAGATLVTVEMAAFELTKIAGTPAFKVISGLVQDRMRAKNSESTAS
jgi:nicotinamidase-related amidase